MPASNVCARRFGAVPRDHVKFVSLLLDVSYDKKLPLKLRVEIYTAVIKEEGTDEIREDKRMRGVGCWEYR